MYKHIKTLSLILVVSLISSCTFLRSLRYNFTDVDDYKIFDNHAFKASETPFQFIESNDINLGDKIMVHPKKTRDKYYEKQSLNKYIGQHFPLAMMVIRNDSILYEKYAKNYSAESLFPSFSMIKSLGVFALVGIAIEEQKIAHLDAKIKGYLPSELRKLDSTITFRNLLNMNSGIKESPLGISPFSSTVTNYYTKNLERSYRKIKSRTPPNGEHLYSATITEILLSNILTHLYGVPLAELFDQKIWSQIDASSNALWSKDRKDGQVKPFCCFNTTTRSYAQLARLYLNKGKYKDKQIVPPFMIEEMFSKQNIQLKEDKRMVSKKRKQKHWYAFHWYRSIEHQNTIKAAGFLSQHILLNPKTNTMLITFSDLEGMKYNFNLHDLYFDVLDQL